MRAKPLFAFFALTYIVSWACFIGSAAISGGSAPSAGLSELASPLYMLGVFAPGIVALAVTARTDGRAGVAALVGRIGLLPDQARWYVFAVSYMAAIKLTVALVHRVITGEWPQFGSEPWYLMAAAIVVSTPVQAGEEVGWRGYALPRLAKHLGLARASVVLGVIWAAWHLPFFFMAGGDKAGQSFPVYLLAVTGMSVALAWLYRRTGGSLLLTMVMHAAANNTTGIVPSPVAGATNPWTLSSSLVAWLTVAMLWIPAVYFLGRMRRAYGFPVETKETG